MGNHNIETTKFVGSAEVHLSVISHAAGRNSVRKMGWLLVII